MHLHCSLVRRAGSVVQGLNLTIHFSAPPHTFNLQLLFTTDLWYIEAEYELQWDAPLVLGHIDTPPLEPLLHLLGLAQDEPADEDGEDVEAAVEPVEEADEGVEGAVDEELPPDALVEAAWPDTQDPVEAKARVGEVVQVGHSHPATGGLVAHTLV